MRINLIRRPRPYRPADYREIHARLWPRCAACELDIDAYPSCDAASCPIHRTEIVRLAAGRWRAYAAGHDADGRTPEGALVALDAVLGAV